MNLKQVLFFNIKTLIHKNKNFTVPSYTQAAAMDAIRRHSAVHYQREFTVRNLTPNNLQL